jgi:hypothetical protein
MLEAIDAGEEGAGRLSGFDAVHDLAEGRIGEVAAPIDEERPHGTGHAGAQEVGDFGVSEAASFILFEDALARQKAQGAVEGVLIHLKLLGEFCSRAPALFEAVCDA